MENKHETKDEIQKKAPKASVFMITYNHEKFIEQAIESVLAQKTNFDFEIVIGEDCSPDNTREICRKYKEKYPDKINLLLPEKNLGIKKNFLETLAACRGEYVAYLEGDDYWTDDSKIQTQVEYLEKNPELVLCFHRESIVDSKSGKELPAWKRNIKEVSSIEDICRGNFISANSVVFRNIPTLTSDFKPESEVVDWSLWVYLAQYGKIGFIDKIMSAYRVHDGGVFSNKTNLEKYIMAAKSAEAWKKMIGNKCGPQYAEIEFYYYTQIIRMLIENKKNRQVAEYLAKIASLMEDNPSLAENLNRTLFHTPVADSDGIDIKSLIDEKEKTVEELIRDVNSKNNDLKAVISERDKIITKLVQEIHLMRSSKFWKLRGIYIKLKHKLN